MFSTKRALRYLLIITIVIVSFRVALFSLKFILASEYPLYIVEGRSMERTFFDGDLLLVRGVADKTNIKLFDIIVFHQPYNREILVVHRVIQINSNTNLTFITKGDNVQTNPLPDPWLINEADIVGVVVTHIPAIFGSVIVTLESPIVTVILVSILIIEYIGYVKEERINAS